MLNKGNCYDNAPIESFSGEEHCSIRKNELVHHQDYKTRFAAISDIIRYIELYYNQTRIQKGLSYKSPRQMWFDFYRQAAQLKSPKFGSKDLTAGVIPPLSLIYLRILAKNYLVA